MTQRLIETWLPIAEIGIESLRERTPMTPFPAPKGPWAVKVSGNWRVTCGFVGKNAEHVDYDQVFPNFRILNSGWATPPRSRNARSCSRVLPTPDMHALLERDYDAMATMITGAVPSFAEVVAAIAVLEQRLNTHP